MVDGRQGIMPGSGTDRSLSMRPIDDLGEKAPHLAIGRCPVTVESAIILGRCDGQGRFLGELIRHGNDCIFVECVLTPETDASP